MKRAAALALVLAAAAPAWAQGEEDEASDEEEDSGDEESASAGDEEEDSGDEEEEETDEDGLPEKQNLSGRDEGTDKTLTEFERNRFFVDKVDTEETEDKT